MSKILITGASGTVGSAFLPPVFDWLANFNAAAQAGDATGVSPDAELLTGHLPRRFAAFARESAARWSA